MRHRGRTIAIVVVIAVTGAAAAAWWWHATSGPNGFRDLRWGASQADLRRAIVIVDCYPSDPAVDLFGTTYCRADRDVRVGDVRPATLLFYLRDDRLVAWKLAYPSEDRAVISGALTARYGRPQPRRAGLAWEGRAGTIEIERGSYLDTAIGVGQEEIARLVKPSQDSVGRAAKGL